MCNAQGKWDSIISSLIAAGMQASRSAGKQIAKFLIEH